MSEKKSIIMVGKAPHILTITPDPDEGAPYGLVIAQKCVVDDKGAFKSVVGSRKYEFRFLSPELGEGVVVRVFNDRDGKITPAAFDANVMLTALRQADVTLQDLADPAGAAKRKAEAEKAKAERAAAREAAKAAKKAGK